MFNLNDSPPPDVNDIINPKDYLLVHGDDRCRCATCGQPIPAGRSGRNCSDCRHLINRLLSPPAEVQLTWENHGSLLSVPMDGASYQQSLDQAAEACKRIEQERNFWDGIK